VSPDTDLRQLVASTADEELPGLGGRLREAELLVELRLRAVHTLTGKHLSTDDENLSAGETARRLGLSKEWVYRHAKKLPFAVDTGSRRVLFSARGLERWNRQRQVGQS
jgi:predicted DNA-binding transcriptional regulator AlpA